MNRKRKMTNSQYVIRTAQMMKLSIIKPSRADKGILVHDWSTGFGKIVVDTKDWAVARTQINAYAMQKANA